ncbi:unnamed protein product [Oppiella nova]|uniref:Uncharacterized protein n=1 Tax=Oppiella nova TaxID=334625 RepID=A0A7R9QYA7_9ACAR|nr:unnamed protein product [Oppiella nova]CAG2178797.1 unnamed protein product [Oppiella nova]
MLWYFIGMSFVGQKYCEEDQGLNKDKSVINTQKCQLCQHNTPVKNPVFTRQGLQRSLYRNSKRGKFFIRNENYRSL